MRWAVRSAFRRSHGHVNEGVKPSHTVFHLLRFICYTERHIAVFLIHDYYWESIIVCLVEMTAKSAFVAASNG